MSDINPIGRPDSASFTPSRPVSRPAPAGGDATPRQYDQVELSTQAQLLSKIAELPDVREDLVARVRREIQAGTYETPDKIDAALAALLREEFGE